MNISTYIYFLIKICYKSVCSWMPGPFICRISKRQHSYNTASLWQSDFVKISCHLRLVSAVFKLINPAAPKSERMRGKHHVFQCAGTILYTVYILLIAGNNNQSFWSLEGIGRTFHAHCNNFLMRKNRFLLLHNKETIGLHILSAWSKCSGLYNLIY